MTSVAGEKRLRFGGASLRSENRRRVMMTRMRMKMYDGSWVTGSRCFDGARRPGVRTCSSMKWGHTRAPGGGTWSLSPAPPSHTHTSLLSTFPSDGHLRFILITAQRKSQFLHQVLLVRDSDSASVTSWSFMVAGSGHGGPR